MSAFTPRKFKQSDRANQKGREDRDLDDKFLVLFRGRSVKKLPGVFFMLELMVLVDFSVPTGLLP